MTVFVATVSADIFENLAFANDLKYFVNPFRDFQIIFHPVCQAFLSRTL
jgi:hypothetical protein